jgi:hypothetical protein
VTRVGRAAVGRMADEIASAFYPKNLAGHRDLSRARSGTDEARSTRWCSRPSRPDRRASRAVAPTSGMLAYFFARDRSGLRRDRRTGGPGHRRRGQRVGERRRGIHPQPPTAAGRPVGRRRRRLLRGLRSDAGAAARDDTAPSAPPRSAR